MSDWGGGFGCFFLFPKRKKTDDEAESRGKEGGREGDEDNGEEVGCGWVWVRVGGGGGGGGWTPRFGSTWEAKKTKQNTTSVRCTSGQHNDTKRHKGMSACDP